MILESLLSGKDYIGYKLKKTGYFFVSNTKDFVLQKLAEEAKIDLSFPGNWGFLLFVLLDFLNEKTSIILSKDEIKILIEKKEKFSITFKSKKEFGEALDTVFTFIYNNVKLQKPG